tara:strand:+ start:572 stop:694 length:123 start_codon:yes stop_codon:yes gene_type:complete
VSALDYTTGTDDTELNVEDKEGNSHSIAKKYIALDPAETI